MHEITVTVCKGKQSGLQYQKEDMEEGAASVLKSMEEMMIHDRQKREANSRKSGSKQHEQ